MPAIEVTEVRIKLSSADVDEKLLAYCSVTLNHSFVIKDVKVIRGDGRLFVAMPSRRITDKCPACGSKNHLRANFCNQCGGELQPDRAESDSRGRARVHFDLIHPINSEVRDHVHQKILDAYEAAAARGSDTDE